MSRLEGSHSSPEKKGHQSKKISGESLSDQKLGDHLAAYGNHEGKAGLLGAMQPYKPYTQGQLANLVNPDEKQLWNKKLPIEWCQGSLEPSGLVAREVVDPRRGFVGYEKTKEGEELGEAFGGHLLEFSENVPVSLYQLSGSTNSPSKIKVYETEAGEKKKTKERAPLTRFRIAKTLVNSELPIRETDLVTSLQTEYPDSYESNAYGLIEKHLSNLAEAGVIIYESNKAESGVSFYRAISVRPEGELKHYGEDVALTYHVDRLLSQSEGSRSAQDVYAALVKQYPNYRKNKEYSLTARISNILAHLTREGYAKNEGFSKEVKSAITLTPLQKKILGRFVDLGEKFQSLDPDFLAEGREKVRAIVADKQRFSALMEKAYFASKYTQKTDQSETSEKIFSYVKDNPGVTNNDIRAYLQGSGQDIGTLRISEITSALRTTGELIGEKKKTQIHYSVPEESQSSTEETVIFGPDSLA